VLALFFSLDLGQANVSAAALVMVVERGSQMVFVLQSCLQLISGVSDAKRCTTYQR
jgi:hypothetical protein